MRSAVLQLFVVAAVVNLQGTFAAGCDCLNTTWPAAALNAKKLPLDYGKYCAAWEDGDATKHSVGNLTTCHEMWPDMVVDDWCCQPWCFVNKTTCPDAVMSSVDPTAPEAEQLYYSYTSACPAATTDTMYTDATCPWGECGCTGTGPGSDALTTAGFSAEYGSYCAAWEDGNCAETGNASTGVHTCGDKKECDEMWWKNNNTAKLASGDWCCQAWCFVSPACPLPDITNSSFNDNSTKLVYSYSACERADTPVKFDDECPYTPDHDDRPGGYQCACLDQTFRAADLTSIGFPTTYGRSCEAWEDGICNTTRIDGHQCGTYTDCNSMWPAEPKGDWCCQPWCYVSDECELSDVTPSLLNDQFGGADFSLSYAACDFGVPEAETAYDDDTCPFEVDLTANPCACLHVTYSDEILESYGMPRDYGHYCAAWDDGDGTRHSLGTNTQCHTLWPDLAVGDWCCQAWCYVDASCPDALPAWANDENDVPLYYSYSAACDAEAGPGLNVETEYSDATCPWGDCECVGDGNAYPPTVTAEIGFAANYGTYCAAWEDGNCGARNDETGMHECGAERKECDEMWWKNPATPKRASGDWCCQSWCYVGANCPLPDVSVSTINTSTPLSLSYNTCQRQDTTAQYTVDVTDSQGEVTEGTCPFTPADDDRIGGWRCACLGETFARNQLLAIGFPADYGTTCAAWEDGDCASHSCGNYTDCRQMWPAEDKGAWCCQPWCFVDKDLCQNPDVEESKLELTNPKLGISYLACDMPAVTPQYPTEAECPWNYDFTANPCECLQKTFAAETLEERGFMRDYGHYCAAWEDGDEGRHLVGRNPSCHTMWPDRDVSESAWCCSPWCFVNPDTCPDAIQSELRGPEGETLHYSYVEACGEIGATGATAAMAETNTGYTAATCPWTDCACNGASMPTNVMEEIGFPRQYGRWCAAWEDGVCDNFATTDVGDGSHPCGSNFECPSMWALNALTLDKPSDHSCCQPWCFVGQNCPLAKNESWIVKSSNGENPLPTRFVSYDTCRRQVLNDEERSVTYTVGDEGTCPFNTGLDVAGVYDVADDDSFTYQVVMTLRMPYEAVADLTEDKQLRFRRAMRGASGRRIGLIRFLSITFFSDERRAGRALLATGVDVETSIGAQSEEDADALADSNTLDIDNINRNLAEQGLPEASLAASPRAVYDGDNEFSGGAIAGMVVGVILGIALLAAFFYYACMKKVPDVPHQHRDVPIAVEANKAEIVTPVPEPEPVPEPQPQPPTETPAPIVPFYQPPMLTPNMGSMQPMMMPPMMGSMPPMMGQMGSSAMPMGSMPPMMGQYGM